MEPVKPPEAEIMRVTGLWQTLIREKTEIDPTHIAGWDKICYFVGWVGFALKRNRIAAENFDPPPWKLPSRGLYFHGAPGRYKTYLSRTIAKALGISFYDVYKIDRMWMQYGADMWNAYVFQDLKSGHCVIDDLGAEAGYHYFGNKTVFAEVFEKRMRCLDNSGILTIVTSNFNMSHWESDPRLYSRLKGLCVPFLFGGEDRRQK